jgi:glucokinase
MTYLSLDLGGSHASCSLVQGARVIATDHLSFADSIHLGTVLPEITACLKQLAARSREPIAGIGIGMCGLVDSRMNRVLSTNGKYIDTIDFDFAAWGRDELGFPVRLENDARLALRGELAVGAGRDFTDVVMFTLGTGIGGVAAMDGKPLLGVHGQAGVLAGHVVVRANGRRCNCGGQGCAEAEASGWALPAICKEWPNFVESSMASMPLNFRSLFACCEAGDKAALEIREHCLTVWGMMTVSAVHCFDPEIVIFGGGAMGAKEQILPFLQDYVNRNTWTHWGKPQLVAAKLGSEAAALGVPSLFEEGGR